MNFITQFQDKPVPNNFEKEDNTMITEQAGYIPPYIQIENMILAGKRLNEARGEYYDEPDENGNYYFNPFNSKNLDMAEVSQLNLAAQAALEASQKAQEALRQEEIKREDQFPDLNTENPV